MRSIGGELVTTITSPSCWGTHFLYLSNPPTGNLLPIIPWVAYYYLRIPMIDIVPSRLPMAHEMSHQTSLDSIFYLGSVVWHNICQDNISRSLNSVLATVKIPSAELGRAQLAENVLVSAVSFHYSQFPPYSVHCWRGSLGGLLQEMFCGCQQHGPSHVPLETNLAAMCKLASSVEVCKYI